MITGLPFNDRALEVSWVFINRENVAPNRPVRFEAEAAPESTPQSPLPNVHGRKSEPAVASLPTSGKARRVRFGYLKSDLDVEYTRTNLG